MATKDTDPVVPDTQSRTSQGEAASGLPDASKDSLFEAARAMPSSVLVSATPISPPYTTPVPTLHDGSTGWVYCEACDAPQPVTGHECPPWQPIVTQLVQAERERLDLAESLLCALAFDHMRLVLLFYGRCVPPDECAFCSAARGGGR